MKKIKMPGNLSNLEISPRNPEKSERYKKRKKKRQK